MSFQLAFYEFYIIGVVRLVMPSYSIVDTVTMCTDFLPTEQIRAHHPISGVVVDIVGLTEHMLKIMLYLCQRLPLSGLQPVCVNVLVANLFQQRQSGVRAVFDHGRRRIVGDVFCFYSIRSDVWIGYNIIRMQLEVRLI